VSTASGSGLSAERRNSAESRRITPAAAGFLVQRPGKEDGLSAMTIEFRDYRHPEDYAAVVALWERCGPGVQLSRSDQADEIRKKLQHDPDLFILAVSEGGVVGTVVGGYDGRRGLIYHLAVEEAHRRQGLGARLMEEIEDRLRQRGCLKSYLLVAPGGEQALDFYRAQGWQVMEVTLMGKELQ